MIFSRAPVFSHLFFYPFRPDSGQLNLDCHYRMDLFLSILCLTCFLLRVARERSKHAMIHLYSLPLSSGEQTALVDLAMGGQVSSQVQISLLTQLVSKINWPAAAQHFPMVITDVVLEGNVPQLKSQLEKDVACEPKISRQQIKRAN